MYRKHVTVLTTLGEVAGLPLGTRIATNHNKLLILDTFAGAEWWFEEAGLQPYSALVEWLPVIVLPPQVDHQRDIKEKVSDLLTVAEPDQVVCEVRVEDDED